MTNKWRLKRENVDVAKKSKARERNWISYKSNKKKRHKDQSYKSKNRLDELRWP